MPSNLGPGAARVRPVLSGLENVTPLNRLLLFEQILHRVLGAVQRLADEPTGNLGSHTGDEIIELLLALRAERQTTLIIATHSAELAARAPRVIQMLNGQVV